MIAGVDVMTRYKSDDEEEFIALTLNLTVHFVIYVSVNRDER